MSSHKFFIYTKQALHYAADRHVFALSPDYDFTTDRYQVLVSEDENVTASNGQSCQFATVLDMDGKIITQGTLDSSHYDEVRGPKGRFCIDYIEVNGIHFGYAPSEELSPGTRYPVIATAKGQSGTTYRANDTVPCFCEGTLIETDHGPTPIEEIAAGVKVMTLDHGLQPVLWAGRFTVSPLQISRDIGLSPITFPPDSVGPGCPNQALSLSGDHQILLGDYEIELYFGVDYALAPARQVSRETQQKTSTLYPLTFYHLLFAEHEVISANGLWCESLFPSPQVLNRLSTKDQWDIDFLIGDTIASQRMAHRSLGHWECTVLTPRRTTEFRAPSQVPSEHRQTA